MPGDFGRYRDTLDARLKAPAIVDVCQARVVIWPAGVLAEAGHAEEGCADRRSRVRRCQAPHPTIQMPRRCAKWR